MISIELESKKLQMILLQLKEAKSLKNVLSQLKEGQPLEISSRDLANYQNGGRLPIENGGHRQPINTMDKREKSAAIVRAYRELKLELLSPPQGIFAEELQGSEFRVRFVRIESSDGGRA